jgi:integrase
MPKVARELSAIEVKRLAGKGFHLVGGVSGLGLKVNDNDGRSWILRTTVGAKRRDIGLGGYPDVSIASARDKAREIKTLIEQGIDPIKARRAARANLISSQEKGATFGEVVERYLASGKLDELSNAKHRAQWATTLREYAVPSLGNYELKDISVLEVKAALDPIWISKNETASRVRQRIEKVLDWATVTGLRNGDNPARWKGNLQSMLPSKARSSPGGANHQPALPLDAVRDWYATLLLQDGMGARALAFLTLTATRSGEVRKALWSELDLAAALWIIPAARMKAGKEHRVPLSAPAIAILEEVPRMLDVPFVFPSRSGRALSDMTISSVMRRMHAAAIASGKAGWLDSQSKEPAVPHGMRSTFRDWAAERTDYPSDMAEYSLAHKVGNAVERAYRRGDMLEKRREMMNEWAAFVTGIAA